MTSLRNRLVPAVATAFAIGAIAISGCGSSNKTSSDTGSTTTTTTIESTTVAGATTTTATTTPPTTTPPTTAKPLTQPTNPPATNPPPTTPQIFTSFSVSNAAACPAPDVTFEAPSPPSVTVSWTVVGADSVQLKIDGGLWGSYGLSGSETLPASCNGELHNVHTYSAVAIKNGAAIATKSATRGS